MIQRHFVPVIVLCVIFAGILLWFHYELLALNITLAKTQSMLSRSNHELSKLKSDMSQFENLTHSMLSVSNYELSILKSGISECRNLTFVLKSGLSECKNLKTITATSGMTPSQWKSFVAMQLHATSNFSAAMYARWSRYLQKEWISDEYRTSTPKAIEWDNCMNGIEYCVISLGLYAHEKTYLDWIITRLPLYRNAMDIFYPGWRLRIYHDESVPLSALESATSRGAETVLVTDFKGHIAGMFWRFFVADDPNVDRYLVRDLDSDFTWRERAAVDEWIRSNLSFHSMADAENHNVAVMGGMWGGTSKQKLPFSIKDKALQNAHQTKHKGGDQTFLQDVVWPEWQTSGSVFIALPFGVYV